jgi:nucleoside-triphosphatase
MSENHSPGYLLAKFFSPGASPKKLTLLTGPRGCGKSTWCQELNRIALDGGISVAGLISLPMILGHQKTGIELLSLPTHERRLLATRQAENIQSQFSQDWCFDADALQWGNTVLAGIRQPQLLIIDELGPLEFYGRQGWQAAFPLVASRTYHWAVVVIRPALLLLAKQRWPWGDTLSLEGGVG